MLWVVETERDVWRLRYEGAAAIAVTEPAGLARLEASHLVGIGEVRVATGRGDEGDRFVRGVAVRAAELGYAGRVLDVRPPQVRGSTSSCVTRARSRRQLRPQRVPI